ncbi:MAG: Hsp20/alpha crystallin family protein [Candidatus Zixiibacteriota bacterium]
MRFVINNPMPRFAQCGFDMPEAAMRRHHVRGHGEFPINMELVESKDSYTIIADLPGMTKEDISIKVENGTLSIQGERKREENENTNVVWSERFFGKFRRDYKLGEKVNVEKIGAEFKNGMLMITLPFKDEIKPKNIEVQVN